MAIAFRADDSAHNLTDLHVNTAAVYVYGRALLRERRDKDPLDHLQVSHEHVIRYYRFPCHEIIRL